MHRMLERDGEFIKCSREWLESINKYLSSRTQTRIKPFALYLGLESLPVMVFANRIAVSLGKKILVKCQKNVLVPVDCECSCVPAFQISDLTSLYRSKVKLHTRSL
jgi:hypothetical protein